ncbi:MAG: hypothetical protein KAJ93_03600 [Methanosarcinales archaeon]|nr:hypothetical protein [Methanosarcinales archaeon]
MIKEQIRIESQREMRDSFPKLVVYSSIAIIIYLFSKLVFIPLGSDLHVLGISTANIISAIAILTILILLWNIMREIRDICNAIGGFLALNVGRKETTDEEVGHYQKAVKGIVYVFVVVVIFMFIGSLLIEISPAASGILLIIIFIWAVITIYSAGMAISAEIEATADELAKKMETTVSENVETD